MTYSSIVLTTVITIEIEACDISLMSKGQFD